MAGYFFVMMIQISLSILLPSVSGCRLLYEGGINPNVYYGWPFSIACSEAINYYYDNEEFPLSRMIKVYTEQKPVKCVIQDLESRSILLNSTKNVSMNGEDVETSEYRYQIENVTDALSSEYQITLTKGGLCWKTNVTLRKSTFNEESCEESLGQSETIITTLHANRIMNFRCDVPSDVVDKPRNLIRSDDVDQFKAQAVWLHNCNTTLPNNTLILSTNDLQIHEVQYSHNLGVYTCAIKYNGMTRYRVHHRACASPPTSRALSATCTGQIVRLYSNASIECTIDAGLGDSVYFGFRGFFYKPSYKTDGYSAKQNEFYCESINGKKQHERITCSLSQTQNPMNKCYWEVPTDEELEAHKTKFTFAYNINDVRESDLGEFVMVFMNADNVNVTTSFTLKVDQELHLIQVQRHLIIAFVALVGMLLMFLLLGKCVGVEVRWIWHYFLKPYEKEYKTYAGYLTYYFSEDMTETVPYQLKQFVNCLNCHLRRKGGAIFDGYKDSSPYQYTTENMMAKLRQCHRVIIILTPEYVKDQWGVHEAYQAWKSAIDNPGVKIIFVMFPTTMPIINNLSMGLKTTLDKALKRHDVIYWDGVLPMSKRMRMHLDLLMPKLPTRKRLKVPKEESTSNSETDKLAVFAEMVSREVLDNLWDYA